jgi:ATP-binding protein involved in chromosome partitioning
VVITIPSDESRRSVARTMGALVDDGRPPVGVIENMAGYACRECHRVGPLFAGSAGAELAGAFGVPLLGRIPFDPASTPADPGPAWAPILDALIGRAR